ncbi:energy transducer TonB [Propionispira raffinosivorans]|uniref:energy transducer TonB n=1 Tax=Propionispira raffinosivorans TaxID=86959 RepID=UPI00037FDBF4|nr:energy transducer TonB [Propionispira raffinosivorans]
MQDNCKNERIAISVSLLLHSIVFILIASTGFFLYVGQPQKQVMDVAIYDAEEKSGSSGSGSPESEVSGMASNSEIVMNADTKKPSISEYYTEKAQKSEQQEEQQKEKTEKQQKGNSQAVSSHNDAGSGSSDKASGQGIGKGEGNKTGNGNKGTGNENGSGSGTGNGDDNANALRPQIPPQLIRATAVSYPRNLRSEGIEGQVVLKMIVGTDGSVESVSLIVSSGYDEMDHAAEAAAYQYRFSPAENSAGDPVRCGVKRTFQFNLN